MARGGGKPAARGKGAANGGRAKPFGGGGNGNGSAVPKPRPATLAAKVPPFSWVEGFLFYFFLIIFRASAFQAASSKAKGVAMAIDKSGSKIAGKNKKRIPPGKGAKAKRAGQVFVGSLLVFFFFFFFKKKPRQRFSPPPPPHFFPYTCCSHRWIRLMVGGHRP